MESLMANCESIISDIRDSESPQKPGEPITPYKKNKDDSYNSSPDLSARDKNQVENDVAPVVEIMSINHSTNLRSSNDASTSEIRHGPGLSVDSDIEIVTPRRRRHISDQISSPSDNEEQP